MQQKEAIKTTVKPKSRTTKSNGSGAQLVGFDDIYSVLVERAGYGLAIITDGVFRFVNSRFAQMTGYDAADLLGQPFTKVITSELSDLAKHQCESGTKGEGIPAIFETELLTINGQTVPVDVNIGKIKYNKKMADMIIVRDITERKQAQQKIQAQYHEIEVHTYELEAANSELQHTQEQLLEINRKLKASQEELSTPVIKVWDKILALPLIGIVDSHRVQNIMEVLLKRIVETQAEMVILDITGVSSIDTSVANHLIKTVQAANMLGTECVITGIKPETAQTMIQLGIDVESFPTRRNLRDGLMYGLKKLGYQVQKAG